MEIRNCTGRIRDISSWSIDLFWSWHFCEWIVPYFPLTPPFCHLFVLKMPGPDTFLMFGAFVFIWSWRWGVSGGEQCVGKGPGLKLNPVRTVLVHGARSTPWAAVEPHKLLMFCGLTQSHESLKWLSEARDACHTPRLLYPSSPILGDWQGCFSSTRVLYVPQGAHIQHNDPLPPSAPDLNVALRLLVTWKAEIPSVFNSYG